jgi:enterochelin esterase-like enzyme
MSVNPDLHKRLILRSITGIGGLVAARAVLGDATMPNAGTTAEGRVETLGPWVSEGLAPRRIQVWLPADFREDQTYDTLYVHDGQMLFDPSKTWNRKAWEIDRVASTLLGGAGLRRFLIVGIDNDPSRRHAEFFPEAALKYLQPEQLRTQFIERALGDRPAADDYVRFIVDTVKPAIDRRFPTNPERESTCIMGSSMGGLISLYAACEYPHIFGGVAALSTHWIGTHERNTEIPTALNTYLRQKLPPTGATRIYMDRGTRDLDALYDSAQNDVDALLRERGYREPDFVTRVYDDAGHDEEAWSARVAVPLKFLFGRH